LLRVRRLADELEIPVIVHLHESKWEIEQSIERCGMRPLARLAKLGLANPLLVAVHMTQTEENDLEILSAAAASVVHCPESNLKLGSGVCPAAELLGRGVAVALGTDDAASNNALDLFGEMKTAGLLASGVGSTPGALVPRDLLRMATLEGARALGLGDCIGSLVPGKWADLCCVNLRAPRTWPVHDLPATVVYAAASNQVTDTWVAGRHLLDEGTLRYLDEALVLDRAEAWRERIDAGLENESHDA
jgi:5-methylthioadenosine/S-adenosylhomocysteine deaminase